MVTAQPSSKSLSPQRSGHTHPTGPDSAPTGPAAGWSEGERVVDSSVAGKTDYPCGLEAEFSTGRISYREVALSVK